MKHAKYVVYLKGGHIARFSDAEAALAYGREHDAEVSAPDGLIGQFQNGQATAEFIHLDVRLSSDD